MKTRSLLGALILVALVTDPADAQRRGSRDSLSRNAPEVLEKFRDTIRTARQSTVRLRVGDDDVALGTIVTPDGKVLTKASEVDGELQAVLHDGRKVVARVVAQDDDWDVALVQIEADDLPVVRWAPDSALIPGRLVLTTGIDEDPLALGVVSSTPRRVRGGSGYLGVMLGDGPDGAHISSVTEGSAAEKAGLEDGDVVTKVGDQDIGDREDLIRAIQDHDSGDTVQLRVRRGEVEMGLSATLGSRSPPANQQRNRRGRGIDGAQSEVRVGFEQALQHDTVLRPQDCGGPLLGLDGRAVALNIARAGRINTYAIPAKEALRLVTRLAGGGSAD